MGTRVAGKCFHSFFEFSQTFTFSISFRKYRNEEKEKQLVYFEHPKLNSLCSSSNRNTVLNQSARELLGLFSKL